MKKLFCILVFFLPVVICAQENRYKSSPSGYAWKKVGTVRFSASQSDYISLAFSPSGQPCVAYEDYGYSRKATVMKFDGTSWINVGNAGFSAAEVDYITLAFSPSGEPYVAYQDGGVTYSAGKATVMKFNGTNWVNVGTPNFSAAEADYTSIAFSPSDGLPYVAYMDFGNTGQATVMKFDGTSWVSVGTAGFSAGWVLGTCLAFSPSGQPYVAYQDQTTNPAWKATVMKFDGTSWVNVGTPGFSSDSVYFISLAISPSDGQPCVAIKDNGNHLKATVMKFDGTNWANVGNAGFSTGGVDCISLAFSPSGQPYVAFRDNGYSGKATVMKFDGTNWVNLGAAGFSSGETYYTSLAFSPSGQPYVAYQNGGPPYSYKTTVMKYDSVYIGINEPKESSLLFYPNPATDIVTIETPGITTPCQLTMMNLKGQELITRQITGPKTELDISNFPSGVYFVRLTNDKTVEVGKIVKK